MELTTLPRNEHRKSETRAMRRRGDIPAVVYSAGGQARSLVINGAEMAAALRATKKGHLPNTVFTLKENGKSTRAVVKDIQYHKVTYAILHLDFLELLDHQPVTLNVPVEMQGQADCVGVKAGGALRLVKRHLLVRCLPAQIPSELQVDVRDLQIRASKRVRDMQLPSGVELQANPQEVVAVVGKR